MDELYTVRRPEEDHFLTVLRKENSPLCVIWGPPGCGKTTFVEHVLSTYKSEADTSFQTIIINCRDVQSDLELANVIVSSLSSDKKYSIDLENHPNVTVQLVQRVRDILTNFHGKIFIHFDGVSKDRKDIVLDFIVRLWKDMKSSGVNLFFILTSEMNLNSGRIKPKRIQLPPFTDAQAKELFLKEFEIDADDDFITCVNRACAGNPQVLQLLGMDITSEGTDGYFTQKEVQYLCRHGKLPEMVNRETLAKSEQWDTVLKDFLETRIPQIVPVRLQEVLHFKNKFKAEDLEGHVALAKHRLIDLIRSSAVNFDPTTQELSVPHTTKAYLNGSAELLDDETTCKSDTEESISVKEQAQKLADIQDMQNDMEKASIEDEQRQPTPASPNGPIHATGTRNIPENCSKLDPKQDSQIIHNLNTTGTVEKVTNNKVKVENTFEEEQSRKLAQFNDKKKTDYPDTTRDRNQLTDPKYVANRSKSLSFTSTDSIEDNEFQPPQDPKPKSPRQNLLEETDERMYAGEKSVDLQGLQTLKKCTNIQPSNLMQNLPLSEKEANNSSSGDVPSTRAKVIQKERPDRSSLKKQYSIEQWEPNMVEVTDPDGKTIIIEETEHIYWDPPGGSTGFDGYGELPSTQIHDSGKMAALSSEGQSVHLNARGAAQETNGEVSGKISNTTAGQSSPEEQQQRSREFADVFSKQQGNAGLTGKEHETPKTREFANVSSKQQGNVVQAETVRTSTIHQHQNNANDSSPPQGDFTHSGGHLEKTVDPTLSQPSTVHDHHPSYTNGHGENNLLQASEVPEQNSPLNLSLNGNKEENITPHFEMLLSTDSSINSILNNT